MKHQTSPNLSYQLDRYFLACSALVGVATLGTQKAEATIQYSGLLNVPVAQTNGFGGVYLDLDGMATATPATGGGAGAALLPGWDFNFYFSSSGTGRLRWYYAGTGSPRTPYAWAVFNTNHVAALSAGVMIDGSSPLGTYQTMIPEYTSTTAFMGVKFLDSSRTGSYFGWIRIQGGPTLGAPASIVDWAYEDSGAGILTGAVPEPSSVALGCLALGAVGVAAWRKRKQA